MSKFSVYVEPIVKEARKRGIHVSSRLTDIAYSFAILEYKKHREYIFQSMTDAVGYVTFKMLFNKEVSHRLLKEAGFPVPKSILTADVQKAVTLLRIKGKVVVKPLGNSGGRGITSDIDTVAGLKKSIIHAQTLTTDHDKRVIVQEYMEGFDHRILVIDKQHVFVVKRVPAQVVGDGKHTVIELIAMWNKVIQLGRELSLTTITRGFLKSGGFTPRSVPKMGEIVSLNNLGNLHSGATAHDMTDDIPEKFKKIARDVARHFNAPVLGIDVITPDISKTFGKITELNPHPDITLHHNPTFGKARNPAEKIVEMLFPEVRSF